MPRSQTSLLHYLAFMWWGGGTYYNIKFFVINIRRKILQDCLRSTSATSVGEESARPCSELQ